MREIQILINPYTISGASADTGDIFVVKIDGNIQSDVAVNMPSAGVAALSIFTEDVGTLTLELETSMGTCSWDTTANIPVGTNELLTMDLYGVPFITPEFSLIIIPGCTDNTRGVNPDINGDCDPALGAPFGGLEGLTSPYCKMGIGMAQTIPLNDGSGATQNDVGYKACNYNPDANQDDGSCYYTGYIDADGLQQQSDDYCDCFGHEEDCSGNCLSQHSVGWCSFAVYDLSSNQLGTYDTNGTGCDIKVCNTDCVEANDFITFWREGSDGQCEDHGGSALWGCDFVDQGAAHPLILDMVNNGLIESVDNNSDGHIDSTTGRLNYNCGHTDCYNCAGVCMNSPFDGLPADQGTDECGECIYGATMDSHQCWPVGTDPDLACIENWSQDCDGRCPSHTNYAGACYGRTDYTDGTCGYDCNNECDGGAEMGVCGCETNLGDVPAEGNNCPDDGSGTACDCDGNCFDCLGVCNGDAYIDECENCCLDNIIYVDGVATEQFCGIQEGECDCAGNIVGCDGDCGSNLVYDDCNICGGNNYFTLMGYSLDGGGTSCIQNTSQLCLNSANGSCGCDANLTFDCTATDAQTTEDFSNSCGGDAVLDECGVCNGQGACAGHAAGGSLGSVVEGECCDCDNNIVDCAGVCGGTSYRDNCGACRPYDFQFTGEMNTFDVNGYPLCETYAGSGIYIQCCAGDINENSSYTETACDGLPILKWCYDGGDNDGEGCGDCTDPSTTPVYQCESPTGDAVGSQGNPLWTTNCNDSISGENCYCPSPGDMTPGGLCVDACGACYGYGNQPPENDGYQAICTGGGGCCSDSVCGCDQECGSTAVVDCAGCCVNGKVGGTGANCTFIGYGSGDTYQATNGIDECGICGGDGIAGIENPQGLNCPTSGGTACDCDGNCVDCAGTCGGDAEELTCPDGACGYEIPEGACNCAGQEEDCAGVCGGSAELDACGICNGIGYYEYYPDPDGDGLICPGSLASSFCPNAAQLQSDVNICGTSGNPCWILTTTHEDWGPFTETSEALCQCPYSIDECGQCIEVGGATQPICELDGDFRYLRTCNSDAEYENQDSSNPCNSRFCKKINYTCNLNECDNSYYISHWVDVMNILGEDVVVEAIIVLPPEYQATTTEPPVEDECGNCLHPQCSQYYGEPSSGVYPVEGGTNPCQQFANIEGESVPTNPLWNAACLDCNGTFGDAINTCSGCYDSVMPTIIEVDDGDGNMIPTVQPDGNCNAAFSCETIIPQTDGTVINMDCDGGDCRDCAGVCNGTATHQWNTHEELFTDFSSVNYCGCSTEDLRYRGTPPYDDVYCCTGIPDCNGVCPEVDGYIGDVGNNGVDCGGDCGGSNIISACCNGLEYCLGQGTYADAVSCEAHVFCGCHNDETACNYIAPSGYPDTVTILFNGTGLGGVDYTCQYPEDVCAEGTYGVEIGDCCGCGDEIIDCDLECEIPGSATSNDPVDWYHDYNCNGLGNGDVVMNVCESQLPQTIGCWSSSLDPSENDFCITSIIWDSTSIPSENGIPIEDYICKTLESYTGSNDCQSIDNNFTCISTEGCKWERDYFFGIDDCGNCFRTGINDDDIDSNFNKWGETAKDCAGTCNGESSIDQCGVCGGDNTSCAGCMDSTADNYDSSATLNCLDVSDEYSTSNGCCIYPTDCMGVSSQDYGNNPAFFDICGICSEGTSNHNENDEVSCLCCPPEGSELYPTSIDNGTYEYSTFTGEDNMWYRYGKCWNGLGSHYEPENWIEPYSPYTESDYPNFSDCTGSCWGTQTVDSCGECGGDTTFGETSGDDCGCDGEIIDDCGQCTQEPMMNTSEGIAGQQCNCLVDETAGTFQQFIYDSCGNCVITPETDCVNTNNCDNYDCNGNCCVGICSDDYNTNAFHNTIPDYGQTNAGNDQCCTMLERDYCGICFGSSTGDAGVGDVGCDGVCFSGNTQQTCGCGVPGEQSPTLHCYDTDGDGLGEGAPVSLCGATTQNPSEGTTGSNPVWIQEQACSDAYTNCTSNVIDQCGACIEEDGEIAENTLCFGCNREDACNFGMNRAGYQCGWGGSTEEETYEGPCYQHDEAVCIFPESCGDCGGTYCPDTAPSTHPVIPDVDIYLGGWGVHLGEGGSSYSLSCSNYVVSNCPTNEGCHTGNKLTYCESSGENILDDCYYRDHCGNCTLGDHNSVTGDWSCYDDGLNNGIDWNDCGCAGCMTEGCPEYDQHVAENGTAPQYQIPGSCSPNDCFGVCGGDAEVDECGVCGGPGAAYECGCTEPENLITDDCDYMNDYGLPCGCDSNDICSGCPTCGQTPDACGECGPDWGGCGGRDCSCTGCMDDTAPNYDADAIVPDNSCAWNDCNGNLVCTQPWEFDGSSSPSIHNTYCNGGYVLDDCGNCIQGTTDNFMFNNCATCNDPDALNYVAPCVDGEECNQLPGPCFYGDLLMIPSVETTQGFDTYIFRAVGNDTNGNQCTEEDAINCNPNYGGIGVVDTSGNNAQVQEYRVTITVTTSEGTLEFVDATAHLNGCPNSDCGNSISAENPYCPDSFNGTGTDNILTFISCGLGKKFFIDGTYTVTLTIGTSVGYFEFSKELIITDTIGFEPSMNQNIFDNSWVKPWQGINLGNQFTIDSNFNYTKQDFIDFDIDKRPSLGLFYYSDYPNNYLNISGNLIDDEGNFSAVKGYINNYYKDDTSISGIKWGGIDGIGKQYEGLIPNIEKECGIDLPAIISDSALTSEPSSGTGFGSNNVCRIYNNAMTRWVPDAMAYTQRSLDGNKSRLWRYYDKNVSPEHYDETTGPTQAIILWQPLTENKMLATKSIYNQSDTNPIYLVDVDWGDGEVSYEKNPYNITENGPFTTHTYNKPGIYEITGYMFSMRKTRTCVNPTTGIHDGRNITCLQDSHCYGYCDVTSLTCVGGGNDGMDCSESNNNCHTNLNDFGDFSKSVMCQDENTPVSDYIPVGVDRFFKFELKININEPEGYNDHPYVLNNTPIIQPIIGGIKDKSIYKKTIERQLGFFPDLPSEESLDLYFQYSYDQYMTEYSLLQMDESYINDDMDINAFMSVYTDPYCQHPSCLDDIPEWNFCRACPTDGSDIWLGKYNEHWGSLGKSIGNSDIGQVRYFNTSVSMAEMLGMDNTFAGNPGLESYWNNIIPKNFDVVFGREPSTYTIDDSGTDILQVNENVNQNWNGGYYYPVLPKINRYGKFDLELGYQETGGVDRIPFGHPNRESWDTEDNFALVTGITSTDFNGNLILDIDFSSQSDGKLQDISGNGNDAYIINDYRIDFEQGTRIPKKQETQLKPELDKDGKQF